MIRKSTQKLLLGILIGLLVVSVYTVLGFMHAHMFIRLPGGYGIYRGGGGVVLRVYDGPINRYPVRREVGPNLCGYRVYNNVIVGEIDQPREQIEGSTASSNPLVERRLGYFFIDQHSRKVVAGLSKKNWLMNLEKYGITEEPNLHTPSWLDKYFGWNKASDR